MAVCPEVKISHVNEADLASLFTGSFLWNRMFAPTRAEVFGWSVFKRIAWIFGTPLIPLVRTIKLVRGVLTLRPQSFWDCLRAIPIALAAHTAAALGQLVGLAAGMGDTEVSFLRYEISRDRQAASDGRSASPT
jgi:hypothetical protein